jgi:hypothetical protein
VVGGSAPYSARSVIAGSSRAARQAGPQQASTGPGPSGLDIPDARARKAQSAGRSQLLGAYSTTNPPTNGPNPAVRSRSFHRAESAIGQ